MIFGLFKKKELPALEIPPPWERTDAATEAAREAQRTREFEQFQVRWAAEQLKPKWYVEIETWDGETYRSHPLEPFTLPCLTSLASARPASPSFCSSKSAASQWARACFDPKSVFGTENEQFIPAVRIKSSRILEQK